MQMVIRIRRNPYFIIGIASVLFTLLSLQLNWNDSLVALLSRLQWQTITGVAMVLVFVFQWTLFLHQQRKDVDAIPKSRFYHKYAGVLFVVLFALHAGIPGHTWMMILCAVAAALVLTGLFNREIVLFRRPWVYKIWLWLHVALAALMIPFVLMHILIALAFK